MILNSSKITKQIECSTYKSIIMKKTQIQAMICGVPPVHFGATALPTI